MRGSGKSFLKKKQVRNTTGTGEDQLEIRVTSAEATNIRNSPRSIPVKTLAVVTEAFPWVRVPVLSNTTYLTI